MDNRPSQAKLMDGRAPAKRMRQATQRDAERVVQLSGVSPTLATVLVGNDPASAVYVRMKRRRCEEVGIASRTIELSAKTTTAELVRRIEQLGLDSSVHAILVQHPIPGTIDRRAAFEAIPLEKDVDSVSSAALGRVILGMDAFASCTPTGIMQLLAEYEVDLDGAHAAVLGRSPILGRPMASMLINAQATVTLCHSRTRNLPEIVGGADVLIAAVGRPEFVQGEWIKPGSVVIDAGYNEGAGGMVGDVDFRAALVRASLITPVPGGVGPMTIAVLLRQTVDAAARQCGVVLSR
jgi:methylenetetrahydrofolate dehydrogenase (NADP+)/methenyltetrahydrofolate cyclohydrolase